MPLHWSLKNSYYMENSSCSSDLLTQFSGVSILPLRKVPPILFFFFFKSKFKKNYCYSEVVSSPSFPYCIFVLMMKKCLFFFFEKVSLILLRQQVKYSLLFPELTLGLTS